jgi:hypothetical protein
MYIAYEAHAQAVRDRQQTLRRAADRHRAVTLTPRCSWLRRLAVRLGATTVSREGCASRPRPGFAESS